MIRLSALAILASLMIGTRAEANVIIGAGSAATGAPSAAGLVGQYFKAASGSTNFKIADTIAAMNATQVSGTFVAKSLSYSGGDSSTITSFLGSDGSSYKGRAAAANDLSDGILRLSGYVYIAAAGDYTFGLQHDDSAQLTIAGQTIISKDCCGTDTNIVTFSAAGYYSLVAIYSNTIYNGGTGGANFAVTENNAVLTSSSLVQGVPEPASLALLGAAIGGFAAVRKWKGRGSPAAKA